MKWAGVGIEEQSITHNQGHGLLVFGSNVHKSNRLHVDKLIRSVELEHDVLTVVHRTSSLATQPDARYYREDGARVDVHQATSTNSIAALAVSHPQQQGKRRKRVRFEQTQRTSVDILPSLETLQTEDRSYCRSRSVRSRTVDCRRCRHALEPGDSYERNEL